MVRKNNKMPLEVSVRLRYLHQDKGVKIHELVKRFPKYSKSNIYIHAKLPDEVRKLDLRKHNKGRPKKLSIRDERKICRTLLMLRVNLGPFSIKRLKLEAGVDANISDQTVTRVLRRHGYHYLQSRKKGLMSKHDARTRLLFARKVKRILSQDFWKTGIGFYFDGASWTHKTNPSDQARSTASMAWRKKSEGLSLNCTTKGKKEGSGGKMIKVFVAIAYGHGAVLCEQYEEQLTGQLFADFVREHFLNTFDNSSNPRGKLFLQDGDPSQNSLKAKNAISNIGARIFPIPPRSPDINPIENFFHLVKTKLNKDALEQNITKESYQEFSNCVKETILNFPAATIDNIIESMNKRMNMIIKKKGQRLRY